MPTRVIQYRGEPYTVSAAHPPTDALPWNLDGPDFADIVESMRADGYDRGRPVLRTPDGRLVEGRRRELAAAVAGVKPVYKDVDWPAAEIARHVAKVDLHRRDLTGSQRAAAVVALAEMAPPGRPPKENPAPGAEFPKTVAALAAEARASERTVEAAAKVRKKDEDLFEQVREGGLSAKTAAEVADLPKRQRKRVAKAANPKAEAKKVLAEARAEADGEPAHPFAGLLADLTKLAGAVTKAVKEESEHGRRLHAYMGVCGLLTHDEVGQKGATLIALRGVYAVVNAAGKKKLLTDKAVRAIYDKASGGWVPPLHARRKKPGASPKKDLVDL